MGGCGQLVWLLIEGDSICLVFDVRCSCGWLMIPVGGNQFIGVCVGGEVDSCGVF